MKKKNFKIIIVILCVIVLILSIIINIQKNNDQEIKLAGIGYECFNDCSKICKIQNTTILTWTANTKTCGCVCKDNSQHIFEIN